MIVIFLLLLCGCCLLCDVRCVKSCPSSCLVNGSVPTGCNRKSGLSQGQIKPDLLMNSDYETYPEYFTVNLQYHTFFIRQHHSIPYHTISSLTIPL